MEDSLLRFSKPVHKESFNYGGMFNGTKSVHLDPDPHDFPYLAVATDGWNRGYGKRYKTLEEAKANLDRLAQKV